MDCQGDYAWHEAQFNSESLARDARKRQRLEALAAGWFPEAFNKERLSREDESDAEPPEVVRSHRRG